MPNQQIEHGAPTRLSTITSLLASQKLRVAGRQDFSIRCVSQYFAEGLASRLLHDDTESSTIMIHDGEDALFVDMSLCLNPWKRSLWLRESKSVIMALGYLELSSVSRPCYLLETFDTLRGWLLCTECSPPALAARSRAARRREPTPGPPRDHRGGGTGPRPCSLEPRRPSAGGTC